MPTSYISRTFSSVITGFTGLESVRWSARFAWIKHVDDDKPVRIPCSKLPYPPEKCSAFTFADARIAALRKKK